MRRLVAILAAIALLTTGFLAVTSLAAQHQNDQQNTTGQDGQQDRQQRGQNASQGGQDRRPEQAMNAEDRRQWAQEKRQQALDRAQQAGLFGQLTYEDGQINGTFIASVLDGDTGVLTDHTLLLNGSTATVIESFETDAATDGNVTVRPSTVHLPFEDGQLRLNDNPTGLVQYRASAPDNVTVEIADGYDVTVDENATKARLDGDINASLLVTGEGSLDADGQTIEVSLEDAGGVLFQAQPEEPGQRVSQRALEHAAEEDRLGGEIRVAGAAGQPANQSTPVDVNLTAQHADHGQAIVEVDGDVDEGRVLNLQIAKANLDVNGTEEVVPKLDREQIPLEDSIDDVVNATSDDARAHVAVHDRVVEVTVWVPDFSLHSVNVQDTTTDVKDIPEPIASTNPSGLDISLAEQTRQQALSQAQAWSDLGAEAQTQATANAQEAGLFGPANLEASTGSLQGAHVQATVDADTGVLEDHRIVDRSTPATLFEEVRPTSFTPAEDAQELGPAVAMLGEELAVVAHDTPTGHLELEASDQATQVELDVPADAEIDRVDEDRLTVTTSTGLEAHIVVAAGEADLIVEGDTIVASLGANAAVHALAEPTDEVPSQANLEQRIRSAAQGELGAEAAITAVDGTPVEDRIETSVELETTDIDEAEGSVTVQASSEVPDPRAVTLNLDPDIVDQTPPDELTVLVDGQAIQAAADADAALDTSQAEASFHVEEAGDGYQVIVGLGGFSDHDITVQSDDDTDDTEGSTDDTDGTDGSADDTDGTDGAEETDDAPFPSVIAVLGLIGSLALLRRRR